MLFLISGTLTRGVLKVISIVWIGVMVELFRGEGLVETTLGVWSRKVCWGSDGGVLLGEPEGPLVWCHILNTRKAAKKIGNKIRKGLPFFI